MSYNISNETPASPTSPGSKPQFRFIVDRVEGDPVTSNGGSAQVALPNGTAVHAGKEPSPPPSYSRYHVTDDYEQMTARPDGEKKAYVRLAPDYDALDVANKIGII